MPLLVDTYNVLHATGVLPPDMAGIDLQGLIDLLQTSRYKREKITLVCDGRAQPARKSAPGSRPSTITVRYSGPSKEADNLIGQLVGASSAPRQLTVVSSDHAVQRMARKRRCKTLSSHELLQQLVHDARLNHVPPTAAGKPQSTMSQEQIDRWINVFKLDEKTVNIPSRAAAEPESTAPTRGSKSAGAKATRRSDSEPQPRKLSASGVVPPSVIEQAEQLWAQQQRAKDRPEST